METIDFARIAYSRNFSVSLFQKFPPPTLLTEKKGVKNDLSGRRSVVPRKPAGTQTAGVKICQRLGSEIQISHSARALRLSPPSGPVAVSIKTNEDGTGRCRRSVGRVAAAVDVDGPTHAFYRKSGGVDAAHTARLASAGAPSRAYARSRSRSIRRRRKFGSRFARNETAPVIVQKSISFRHRAESHKSPPPIHSCCCTNERIRCFGKRRRASADKIVRERLDD